MAMFDQLVQVCSILEGSALKWQISGNMLDISVLCWKVCLVSCKTMFVVFRKKCEAENVLTDLGWSFAPWVSGFTNCVLFLIIVCNQS